MQEGARPQQVQESKDDVNRAQTRLDTDTAQYNRDSSLAAQNLVPKVTVDTEKATLADDQSSLDSAKQGLDLTTIGVRPEELQIARDEIAQNEQHLAQLQLSLQTMYSGTRPERLSELRLAMNAAQTAATHTETLSQRGVVRAPISGVIVARNVNEGEVAGPSAARSSDGTPIYNNAKALFTVADDTTVEFQAYVDQTYLRWVHVGMPASVYLESMPDHSFHGVIDRFNPLISSDAGSANANQPLTFQVWVRVPNAKRQIVVGQTGYISLSNKQSGLTIPRNAVSTMSLGQGLVYVYDNHLVHVRNVRYDASGNGNIHVVSGLHEGDQIVVNPSPTLRDGTEVTARAATNKDLNSGAMVGG